MGGGKSGGAKWLCAMLAAWVLVACQDPYEAGLQAFDSGDWPTAITRLKRVDPFHLHHRDAQDLIRQSIYNAGVDAFDTAQWTTALSYLKRVKESDPNFATARDYIGASFYELAVQALDGGDFQEALRLSNIVRSTCSRYQLARELAHEAQQLASGRHADATSL